MICMYREDVSSVQVLMPLFHTRDNCETLLFIMSIILLGADEFSNSIPPKFYLSFWTTCSYKERFRRCFVTERKRRWEVREALKAISHTGA